MPDDNPLDPAQRQASAEPTGLSVADAVNLIQQATTPLVDQITKLTEAQASSHNQLSELTQNISSGFNRNSQEPTQTADFLTELTTGNAEEAIARIVDQRLGSLTPILSGMIRSGSGAFIDIEAQALDQKFGTGAWDKFFQGPMKHIMDSYAKTDPAKLSDRQTINKEVNGLKGQLLDQLVEFRDAYQTTTTEQKAAELTKLKEGIMADFQSRTNGTGGIRPFAPVGSEVTDEIRGYLQERDRAIGAKTDPKGWLEETNFGNDLDSYLTHKNSQSKGNGVAQ